MDIFYGGSYASTRPRTDYFDVAQPTAQIDQIYDRFVQLRDAQDAAHSGGYSTVAAAQRM